MIEFTGKCIFLFRISLIMLNQQHLTCIQVAPSLKLSQNINYHERFSQFSSLSPS
jgi:hypothetical protein